MNTISISQLKINPSSAISLAAEYPIKVENRKKVEAYLVGKELFEKLISMIEDKTDDIAVKNTDFSKGKNFEEVAGELGI